MLFRGKMLLSEVINNTKLHYSQTVEVYCTLEFRLDGTKINGENEAAW